MDFKEGYSIDVRITSYINGLHPRHQSLYYAIEKLVFRPLSSLGMTS